MKVFKIRMTAENHDNFLREFEVKSSATFKNLHDFFVKSLQLDQRELASFFISDENWNKLQEITLVDMMAAGPSEKQDGKIQNPILLMDKVKLEHYISEVDDKIIYTYDFLQMHTFLLEVIDITHMESASPTPTLTYSTGKFKSDENLKIENDPEKLKQQLLKDFEMMTGDDDEDSGPWDDDD
jgi:hypothetical protein